MATDPNAPAADPNNPNPITPPPAFDPEAFATRILGEVNKGFNAMDKKFNALSKSVTPAAPAAAGPNAPAPADPAVAPDPPANPKITPEVNAELAQLKRQIAQLTSDNKKANDDKETERKSRLDTERATAIRGALNDIPFHTDELRSLFFEAVQKDIKREEDGTFVADSEAGVLPMKTYLKDLAERKYGQMLVPKGGGGAGANAGNATRKPSAPIKQSDLTAHNINTKTKAEQEVILREIMAGNVT